MATCIQPFMKLTCIGTAGWSVSSIQAQRCQNMGSHLERYAAMMNCVEVNSSFYRPHQRKTWERWALATPHDFKFAVKVPKAITHFAKLQHCNDLLAQFLDQTAGLGEKLGPVLLQLAPGHAFDLSVVQHFLGTLREMHRGPVALEPRNVSWFTPEADRTLCEFNIARVVADPPKGSPLAARPGGATALRYYRLHGAPRVYWSGYDAAQIEIRAEQLREPESTESWVIFDNTAAGEALKNALELKTLMED
jgi:uncharacterized protein YecE (DUF72 family)